jgi:hypothetical protein
MAVEMAVMDYLRVIYWHLSDEITEIKLNVQTSSVERYHCTNLLEASADITGHDCIIY